jgi:glycogen synthase
MKVVLLGPYPPPHGGVQTNLVAIRECLRDRQVSCDVINLTRYRRPDAEGIYYPTNPLEVAWLLVRGRYDIIHLHVGGELKPRLLALCFLCSLLPWAKTVLTFHSGGYPSSGPGRTARRMSLRGFVLRRLDRVIGVNQELVELFRKFGVAGDRVLLIPPFALPSGPPEAQYPEVLEHFLRAHRPVIVTVGQSEPEYDLPLQIEALGVLQSRLPAAGLVIVGSGSLEEELRFRIATQPHGDRILICGDLPHAVTLRLIAECDLLLRTSLYDGDSIAVREAIHFDVPVVATDNGMRPAGVHLIALHDLDGLCRAIELHATGPQLLKRQSGVEHQSNVEAVWQLYSELVAPVAGG